MDKCCKEQKQLLYDKMKYSCSFAGEDTAFAPLVSDLLQLLEGKGKLQVSHFVNESCLHYDLAAQHHSYGGQDAVQCVQCGVHQRDVDSGLYRPGGQVTCRTLSLLCRAFMTWASSMSVRCSVGFLPQGPTPLMW